MARNLFNTLIWLTLMIMTTVHNASCEEKIEIDRFISPETCGDCHSDIYRQWKNSMHNLSDTDPVYLGVSQYMLKGLTDKNEIAEAESCVKCHVPVGVVTGYPKKTSDDRAAIPELAMKGIQCDYCHSAVDVKKMYNNGLMISPGNGEDDPGIKRGPRTDSESDFHETAFSELHTGSEICGTCHNVKHVAFGTDLETTYDEWKNGPYNSKDAGKRTTCQGCHMYQRPGIPATGSTERPNNRGSAVDDGPEREHIFTHFFVGANGFVPGSSNDHEKSKMAEERLKNAAELSLDSKNIRNGKLVVKIKNSGAGHKLPTGLTDVRQMWLEVNITDETGKKVYSSGVLDENGYLPDNAFIYHTVFGDGKGKPVSNISKARKIIKDNRILPGQEVAETLQLPDGKRKVLSVNVKLLYRSAPQRIVDEIFGREKLILPVITMTEINEEIRM